MKHHLPSDLTPSQRKAARAKARREAAKAGPVYPEWMTPEMVAEDENDRRIATLKRCFFAILERGRSDLSPELNRTLVARAEDSAYVNANDTHPDAPEGADWWQCACSTLEDCLDCAADYYPDLFPNE